MEPYYNGHYCWDWFTRQSIPKWILGQRLVGHFWPWSVFSNRRFGSFAVKTSRPSVRWYDTVQNIVDTTWDSRRKKESELRANSTILTSAAFRACDWSRFSCTVQAKSTLPRSTVQTYGQYLYFVVLKLCMSSQHSGIKDSARLVGGEKVVDL